MSPHSHQHCQDTEDGDGTPSCCSMKHWISRDKDHPLGLEGAQEGALRLPGRDREQRLKAWNISLCNVS